jgi:3-oxoacyl-(acyl-carrier-protein) synthase/NAD(P)-dependent dehydrogenase (short-subunit alcohol dehydrogenase family)
MVNMLEGIEPDAARREKFSANLRRVWGEPPADLSRDSQSKSYKTIIGAMTGRPIRTYVIDAACSSSLYAIGLGFRSLQDRATDVMLVGGAFAPAMANSALFAQFRGLSPTGSRPLDKNADGVIFGEGAGILVLKRLSDALSSGDKILGVVRGVGISSDGKSPAINVPQSRGQSIAIRRAYEASHIDPNSIQYIEAHATATPVGDAVEFEALRQAISRESSLPRIELGSVKALIGHTGWAAGAASVIKLCKAFENGTIPPQHNYSSPSTEIALDDSPFRISTKAQAWPSNIKSLPRRSAINGFGFGGTNAHLILEEFSPAYHKKLCANLAPKTPQPVRLAVIGTSTLFPAEQGLEGAAPATRKEFNRSAMRLPKGKMLLPDVTEHMDPGQHLAMLAAEKVLPGLGERMKELRGTTGVVIGVESKTERGILANQRIFLDRMKRRFTEDGAADSALLDKLFEAVRKQVIPSGPYTLAGLMPNVISGRVANMYDLNGPNIVIDMGPNSLVQSMLVARDFLAHGDCKAVLAGGLNAVRMSGEDREGVFLTLLTTEATARELNLPVSCYLTIDSSVASKLVSARTYRGAEGALEISEAIAKAASGAGEVAVGNLIFTSTAPVKKEERPAAKAEPVAASSTYAYVQGTPIDCYAPVEVARELPLSAAPAKAQKYLFLVDQLEEWSNLEKSGALGNLDYHVLGTQSAAVQKFSFADLANDDAVGKALALLPAFDTIVPVKFLGRSGADSLLVDQSPALVDLLFAVSRFAYEGLQSGKLSMASLSLGAFIDGKLNPFTGLLSGFVKSIARELPAAVCRSLNVSDSDFGKALRIVESELSHQSAHQGQPVDVCYRGGTRSVIQLARIEKISQGETPILGKESVVLATGGGRGVTATLVEEILTKFGCTVIAIGRTDPTQAPAEILKMSADQLAGYEQEFYRTELAKGGKKITQLKNQFRSYQAAHEVNEIVGRLKALPGRFEYISADITDRAATSAIVDRVFDRFGRLDFVLHGAGVQISKVLTKKTIGDFQSVVRAKLASLNTIHAVCEKRRGSRPIEYHLLTSAFSYMGNDGQPDYGAVNECLNRLAEAMNAKNSSARWCSVAWLGWAGIGMTRGSEFAALAASRGLRGITKSEGQEIFSHFLTGSPTSAINILMAEGERKFYSVATTANSYAPSPKSAPPAPKRDQITIEKTVTVGSAPYVLNHRVDGIPTLPGAFLIMMVGVAALELRPNLKITAFEDASFRRFVRLREDGPTNLRLVTSLVSEDERSTLVRVQVVSDFVHKNGMVLQKDVVQTEISVRMGASIGRPAYANGVSRPSGRTLEDPYVMEGSPIHLNGPFRTLKNIVVGDGGRSAEYSPMEKVEGGTGYQAFLPNLLVMDSLWRFGAIDMDDHDSLPVYVPEACKVMNVYYDLSSADTSSLRSGLCMTGSNPMEDHDRLTIGPVQVRDASGSILLTVDGGVCRRLGEVRNGH